MSYSQSGHAVRRYPISIGEPRTKSSVTMKSDCRSNPMVLDTSAVLAILLMEPDAAPFAAAIADQPTRLMSSLSLLEASIVLHARKGPAALRELDLLIHHSRIEIVAFTAEQAEAARDAWQRYGKGNHAASLNLGDCCSYALSRISGEPLLFKGSDFAQTDVLQCPLE
jgi:ribonuclease VapC